MWAAGPLQANVARSSPVNVTRMMRVTRTRRITRRRRGGGVSAPSDVGDVSIVMGLLHIFLMPQVDGEELADEDGDLWVVEAPVACPNNGVEGHRHAGRLQRRRQ
jgi:hypothetical protein